MSRSLYLIIVLTLFVSSAFAGFGSGYSSPYSSDSVIAPISIKDKGMYNLVISIQFLNEPYEKGIYESDNYKNYIRRLNIEWSGIALHQVLQSKEQSIYDLAALKTKIESEILKLANSLKGIYSLKDNTEVVFSLSNFYLLSQDND